MAVWTKLAFAASILTLAGCDGGKGGAFTSDGNGVDAMTNRPWAQINMVSVNDALTLWIQCDGDNAKIGLTAKDHLTDQDGVNVLTKFGDDKDTLDETWETTTENNGALHNGSDDAFIKRMLSAPTIMVRMTPIGSQVLDATFDTSHLADYLKKYANRCGWGDLLQSVATNGQNEVSMTVPLNAEATTPDTTDSTTPANTATNATGQGAAFFAKP